MLRNPEFRKIYAHSIGSTHIFEFYIIKENCPMDGDNTKRMDEY